MRILQMAGPALQRCNVGAYNCSYAPTDSLFSFAELLYILMQGTGAGFSAESDYVTELPRIKKQRGKKPDVIIVPDYTEGWCDSYYKALQRWFDGYDCTFDTTGVRKKNAVLKTKGGRSSGPGPFLELMDFSRNVIFARQGRFLEDSDVHRLSCFTGRIVQVGGVRRAAEIGLSDLKSTIRDIKAGPWYVSDPFWVDGRYLSMANNSAVYEEYPEVEVFMEEMLALVKSKSGERGIFNREGAINKRPARRQAARFGCNPCVTADTWVMTDTGPRRVEDLLDDPFVALVNGRPCPATPFVQTGVRTVFKLVLANGMTVRATGNHRILTAKVTQKVTRTAWKQLNVIRPGDMVVLHDHRPCAAWSGTGTEAEGYLLGSLIGDGCFGSDGQALLDFWGDDRGFMCANVLDMVHASVEYHGGCLGSEQQARVGKTRIQSIGVGRLAERYGIDTERLVTDAVEKTSCGSAV